MKTLKAPVATDDVTVKADFLELTSFVAQDGNVSLQDLVRLIRRSGSTDALERRPEFDAGSELSQAVAEDALAELDDRKLACGGGDAYPFAVGERLLQLADAAQLAPYTFMLLLTKFGIYAGPKKLKGERIFEDICRHAAAQYFGGDDGEALHFGFPRRIMPKAFPAALQALCVRIGDMVANDDHPRSAQQKDGKLDIVAWRNFPDQRPGKLIGFGQCAAGHSQWKQKAVELQVESFKKKWLRQPLSVDPVRMFFVPWRVPTEDHRDLCIDGGIVFDRCRIAYFCDGIDETLAGECATWSEHVIKRKLK